MRTLQTKRKLLEAAGYVYNFKRMVYVNRSARKVFSIEAVDDKPESWLKDCIKRENDPEQWQFHFNSPPSESVKQQLLRDLGA